MRIAVCAAGLLCALSLFHDSRGEASSELTRSLSTKTPYFPLAKDLEAARPQGCTAVQVNHVGRHGTRYPTKVVQQRVASLEGAAKDQQTLWGRSTLKAPFDQLLEWNPPWLPEQADTLTPGGVVEMEGIATRLAEAFPELLSDPSKIRARSDAQMKTHASAEAFMDKLGNALNHWNHSSGEVVIQEVEDPQDPVMSPPMGCPRWIAEIGKGPYALYEVDEYKWGTEMLSTAQRVGARMGWASFRAADLINVYAACAAEVDSTGNSSSVWCQALYQEDLEVLTYLKDLEAYYKFGYGHEIAHHCGVALLGDLWASIKGAVAGDESALRADLRFGSQSTVLPLMTLLGLFKDEYTLDAERSAFGSADRKWATSDIMPMGSSVLLVVYECDGRHNLQLLVNEQVMQIPGCRGLLCEPDTFYRAYKHYLKEDSFEQVCEVDPNANKLSPMAFALLSSGVLGLVSATFLFTYYTMRQSITPAGVHLHTAMRTRSAMYS